MLRAPRILVGAISERKTGTACYVIDISNDQTRKKKKKKEKKDFYDYDILVYGGENLKYLISKTNTTTKKEPSNNEHGKVYCCCV